MPIFQNVRFSEFNYVIVNIFIKKPFKVQYT